MNEEKKKIPPQESLPQNPNFPKNETGETFGSDGHLSPYEKGPDLIKTRGIKGKTGYIRQTDIDGELPKSREEALAQQAKKETRIINVYESDGKTIVDQFVIKPVSDEVRKKRDKHFEQYLADKLKQQ